MSRDEGFLARWSRRKLAAPPPEPTTPAVVPEELDPAVRAARDLLDAAPELGNAALRAMWRTDPGLAAVDPLDLHNLVDCTAATVAAVTQVLVEGAEALEKLAADQPDPPLVGNPPPSR
ncbi:MAG: hypothetical protein HQL38_19400 [Alphaproteobacteria bacterium]|nr:hypothetical protein [Alphaproteobacteria bacterium]MBF0394847.1 hypothetical protein [Alphaproteobacteria bacterium]